MDCAVQQQAQEGCRPDEENLGTDRPGAEVIMYENNGQKDSIGFPMVRQDIR